MPTLLKPKKISKDIEQVCTFYIWKSVHFVCWEKKPKPNYENSIPLVSAFKFHNIAKKYSIDVAMLMKFLRLLHYVFQKITTLQQMQLDK